MKAFLLDVNVLVALFDASHMNHQAAHRWFSESGKRSWATCPIAENGLVRVLSSPAYPTVEATPAEVIARLREFRRHKGHVFWPDAVSLCNARLFAAGFVPGSGQVTDAYLLGLAAKNGGRLATFDRRISGSWLAAKSAAAVELVDA